MARTDCEDKMLTIVGGEEVGGGCRDDREVVLIPIVILPWMGYN